MAPPCQALDYAECPLGQRECALECLIQEGQEEHIERGEE